MRIIVLVVLLASVGCSNGYPTDQTYPPVARAETPKLEQWPPGESLTLFAAPATVNGTSLRYIRIRRSDGALYGAWVEPDFSKKPGDPVTLWDASVYHSTDVPQYAAAKFVLAR